MKHLALGFLLLALGCTTVSVPFPPEMYDDSTPTLDAGPTDDGEDTADADQSPSDEDSVDAGPSEDDSPGDAGADADGSEVPEDGN